MFKAELTIATMHMYNLLFLSLSIIGTSMDRLIAFQSQNNPNEINRSSRVHAPYLPVIERLKTNRWQIRIIVVINSGGDYGQTVNIYLHNTLFSYHALS